MLFSLVLSAAVPAAAPEPPIQVESCSIIRANSFEQSVRIRFRNTSDRTASIVAFDVHNGPHYITVRADGTFAPGATVDRTMPTPTYELYHAQPHACPVSFVRFQDGTTWTPPGNR